MLVDSSEKKLKADLEQQRIEVMESHLLDLQNNKMSSSGSMRDGTRPSQANSTRTLKKFWPISTKSHAKRYRHSSQDLQKPNQQYRLPLRNVDRICLRLQRKRKEPKERRRARRTRSLKRKNRYHSNCRSRNKKKQNLT